MVFDDSDWEIQRQTKRDMVFDKILRVMTNVTDGVSLAFFEMNNAS